MCISDKGKIPIDRIGADTLEGQDGRQELSLAKDKMITDVRAVSATATGIALISSYFYSANNSPMSRNVVHRIEHHSVHSASAKRDTSKNWRASCANSLRDTRISFSHFRGKKERLLE
jgi:hypothetical protein